MKIAILGFGKQGRSAYEYWQDGNDITVCDGNENLVLPDGVTAQLGPKHLENLDGFDFIVRSPIVHPRAIVAANNPAILDKVTTNTNEFFRVCPTKNIIGVTGTKGKGTTSTLITRMLQEAGKQVYLGGNIGTPPLELLQNNIQPDDWVVLELANFQLIDLHYSPKIAVCLMVVPEHLDWHSDMAEYVAAKQQLFRWQTPDDIAIFYPDNHYSRQIAEVSNAIKLPYMAAPGAYIANTDILIQDHVICNVDDIRLLGVHNQQNVCAALTAAWQITQNIPALRTVLTSFSGLPHRLELVRELNDVAYYDDSFGTTPETAIVALQAFAQPKVIILGGSDKGADYGELAAILQQSLIREVLLIGEQAQRIQQALQVAGFTNFTPGGTTMQAIVETARSIAQPGDVVLLSTGCASFDMFKNYEDRGDQFKQAVQALA